VAVSTKPAHDLGDLIKWTARDEWRGRVDTVMAEHFEPAMEAFSLTFEEIDDTLGGGWAGTLWGCAFEDFLTRRFGPEGVNPVEAYLRHRGWKERAATRAYMTALQGSVMSLHEVSDIVPGQSLRTRDLLRDGEPVTVTERTATRTLKPWDRIAARVVPEGDRFVLAGGLLAFTLEGSERLFAALREHGPARPRGPRARKAGGALEGRCSAPPGCWTCCRGRSTARRRRSSTVTVTKSSFTPCASRSAPVPRSARSKPGSPA
jgi:hypothetical protein